MSPFLTSGGFPAPDEPTNFSPGIKVAVIGAGVSGICAAAYLLKEGADVTVFERSDVTSGVWHYDPRAATDTKYPSEKPSAGDYATSIPGQFLPNTIQSKKHSDSNKYPLESEDHNALNVAFSPPGPAYFGLRNNVPTSLLYSNLGSWPEGTEDITGHANIQSYLQGLSKQHGVDDATVFQTRVEEVTKSDDDNYWNLRTITLHKGDGEPKLTERNWKFDAVVVSTGHYNLPRIPDTPGLAEWKAHFGDAVIHTKQYRRPEQYAGKTVLVVGGGASAYDVCREVGEVAKKVIQSTRGGDFDLPSSMFPDNIEHVGAIEKFVLEKDESTGSVKSFVLLHNGQTLDDVDGIVLATGYLTSYPFLQQYHRDDVAVDDATREILITSEGSMVHNLHKDIFYTEDPSLSFIGVPYYTATFSLFDFQAQVLARVLTGKTTLPSQEAMRRDYDDRVASKGRGRKFHSLAGDGEEVEYVKDLLHWANSNLVDDELEPLKGHSKEWLDTYNEQRERRKLLRVAKGAEPEGLWARASDLEKA
ncbi:related to monooxygenase [Fusarium torulosum]|uniref:Related to monooxygenase n=1 Tax=Fusarium torulosum TaxID=33205 RepID=A0AAE8SFN5_9HYPO|nr:related to monooxygenase [Fusarium torulosum]